MRKISRTLERKLDDLILSTLSYRAIFHASLSYHQLYTFLIDSENRIEENFDDFATTLEVRIKNLLRRSKVKEKKTKYYVPSDSSLASWDLRYRYSTEMMLEAETIAKHLNKIPWIKLCAVSGSVAAFNAKKDDDIDIFVITQEKRLWITRFFVVLILKVLGKYTTEKNSNRKVCPNIFIDSSNLEWEKKKQNIYTAHEILMLQPLINRNNFYEKFILANDWVFKFFPNFKVNFASSTFLKDTALKSSLLEKIEFIFMVLQLWYMESKKTNEVTSKSFIHFNKHDHSTEVLKFFN